jgi:two-component system sensor histidine kinase CpxA
MKLRIPIYGQILAWFFLNLAVLGAILCLLARLEFRVGLDSLLLSASGERIQAVGSVIAEELSERGPSEWDAILRRFSDAYGIEFTLFLNDASQLAGSRTDLPASVRQKILEGRVPSRPALREPVPPRQRKPDGGSPQPGAARAGRDSKFTVRTSDPTRYWAGIRIPVADGKEPRRLQTTLLAASTSLSGGGLFVDVKPWLFAALGAVGLSVLLWLPFVRGVTRSIAELAGATERIAEGQFDVQVEVKRGDELGRLARAVNRLAARLEGFVTGQKRFLGDVAHEFCSPLARLQMALGILEQRVQERERPCVEDLRAEAGAMSQLVNELLSFSKAGLKPGEIKLRPVDLPSVVRRVTAREAGGTARVEIDIPEGLQAIAEPELLARALGNVLRNAVRHAASAGPITIAARPENGWVVVSIADCGPGVPPESLPRLFDPFYRVDDSRTRGTGGVGLGLAIVRGCVEGCDGRVTARNRDSGGLEVSLYLTIAEPRNQSRTR